MSDPAKAILVTGAARRVGAAIARALHAAGANVIVHCNRSKADAEALVKSLNGARAKSAVVVQGDLLAYNALKGLIEHAASEFGRLDGLVNNASSFYPTPMGAIDEDQWTDLIDSNLKAPLFLSQAAAPHLKRTHGAIVNIIDIHAERPLKNFAVYSTAKAGLAGLTRALAIELGPEVRVNGVAPGAILWPETGSDFPGAEQQRITAQTPLKRTGTPEDIAGAVKMLMLDTPFVAGQILAVDGGRSLAL
ncbi:MAG TPA: pteridine reductase [Usitatibacteraceae bacterium]|nr:pteridine reductase [Usitatibacteraceae bacterium]